MVPLSVLGEMRRAMLVQLDASLASAGPCRIAVEPVLEVLRAADRARLPGTAPSGAADEGRLHVLCRTLGQLDMVLAEGIRDVYAELQDIRECAAAVQRARARGAMLSLVTPRIEKPGERGVFHALRKCAPCGVLVRNLGGLSYFTACGVPSVADFSLNATNELSVGALEALGARRVTASYDLNRDQLLDLVRVVRPRSLEIVIHQHMPMFHMEHCVFCAVLSPGTNKSNCGRPCDRHQVRLRDRIGMEHPLHADVGCRNTLFNAVAQSAAEVVPELLDVGLRDFRLELLHETDAEIREMLAWYRELLAGRATGRDVWRRLRAANRVGVTRGTLEERRNPLAIL